MDAQADLGLHCLHMPKDKFSHGAAHMVICILKIVCLAYTTMFNYCLAGSIVQLVAHQTADPGVSSLSQLGHITLMEVDHETISMIILPPRQRFKKGSCQLRAKVCAQRIGELLRGMLKKCDRRLNDRLDMALTVLAGP